jgi:hypothetical protein
MAKKAKKVEVAPLRYKGYDMKWLRSDDAIDHPDRHLVAEYDKKYGKAVK